MPQKCSVENCKSNYDSSNDKVTVFKFPSDPEKLELWLSALPNTSKKETVT